MGKLSNTEPKGLSEKLVNRKSDISITSQMRNTSQHEMQEFHEERHKSDSKIIKITNDRFNKDEEKQNNKNAGINNHQIYQLDLQNKQNQANQNNNELASNKQSKIINIPQEKGQEQTQANNGQNARNEVQREVSMLEINISKLKNSRVSYQDLDELHEDLLDEREQNDLDEKGGILSKMCRCFTKKERKVDDWLKHFKLLVKNNRYLENSWSGGLFNMINSRFQDYNNTDAEQQELHMNAQNTLDDSKLKRLSSFPTFTPQGKNTYDDRQNSNTSFTTQSQDKIRDPSEYVAKELKQVIQNSIILEEDIESLRESLRNEQILDQFDYSMERPQYNSGNSDEIQPRMQHDVLNNIKKSENEKSNQSRSQTEQIRKQSTNQRNQKMEIIGRSIDIVTQQSDQKPPKVKVESKYKNRIRSSSLKRKNLPQSQGRIDSEKTPSAFSNPNNDSRFDDSVTQEESGDDALGQITNTVKTNTLLINSEVLQEKDFELYQAVVFYKSITFVIEQHLNEENNFVKEKPLRVIRDNFVEFYTRTYGQDLQNLGEDQIIESIQNLKEFVTLFLEIIREYYKLDSLVDKCLYADRFITTDNLINFLCSIIFQDDAVYSIVYVSHQHFEPKLSLRYFKNVKALFEHIELESLKVNEEYCLNEKTLIKLKSKMEKTNCSINDTISLKGYKFKPPFQKAFEHFKNIAHQRSPVHKLKVIIKTQDLINECIKDFYDYFGIDYTDIYYDADNLVGIFSYILIKSEVYDIISHCKIIENFATKNTLNSHSGYLLVTLQCCIRFISTLNAPLLLSQGIIELIKF